MERIMDKLVAEMKQYSKKLGDVLSQLVDMENAQGSLVFRNRDGRIEFYRYIDQNLRLEYLGLDKTDVLASLAQKRYDKQLLNTVKKQKKAVDSCIKKLEEAGMEDVSRIYSSFPVEIRHYIEPHMDDDQQYAAKWQAREYAKSRRNNETDNYTCKGEHVRSKSEVIIADRFHDRGIPYHYEPIFWVDENDYMVPDFIVLNKNTRQEFLWEHCGMMDNPDYCYAALSKMEAYAREGYIMGKNLICSFESSRHPLSLSFLDQLIEEYLE